jgi:tRNA G10  N-methylase Trm11
MKSICVLGRQPGLGIAELESLLGPKPVTPLIPGIAGLDLEAVSVPFSRLGGTVKLAKLLAELPTTDIGQVEKYLHDTIPEHLQYVPEGKFTLGLSFYGFDVSPARINAAGLRLKKTIKKLGRSVRIVPNKSPDLNSAQILHNNLTGMNGWELLLIRHGTVTYLAQTTGVQDIDAYAARDQERPKRDARVGMLPPKLAQIIINLAADGMLTEGNTVLDPFCGSGVIMQEAALMGFDVYGSDIDTRMVEYTSGNFDWLLQRYPSVHAAHAFETGDATSYRWQPFDTVASELFLGKPLTSLPKPPELEAIVAEADGIFNSFLRNMHSQLPEGARVCLAVPAWSDGRGFKRLPSLDRLEKIGYNRLRFIHVDNEELTYHRPGQTVGRELVVLTRK